MPSTNNEREREKMKKLAFNNMVSAALLKESLARQYVKVDEPLFNGYSIEDNFTYDIKVDSHRFGTFGLYFLPYGKLAGSDGGMYRIMSDVTVKDIMKYLKAVGKMERLEDHEDWENYEE